MHENQSLTSLHGSYDQANKKFQKNIPVLKALYETYFLQLTTFKQGESTTKNSTSTGFDPVITLKDSVRKNAAQ